MSDFIEIKKKDLLTNEFVLLNEEQPETFLKFFTGENTIIELQLNRLEDNLLELPLNDILINFIANISDNEVQFINESPLTNRVYITNPDNEKRAFLTLYNNLDNEIKPDSTGYFYIKSLWETNTSISLKLRIEVESGFTSSYVEESSFNGVFLSVNTSTSV